MALPVLLALTIADSPAFAQVKLRFKYNTGDAFGMTVSQDMTSKAQVQGRDVETKMHQTMQMLANVEEENSDGTSKIKQTIDRVQTKMTLPAAGQAFEYDSAEDENRKAPPGFAAIMDKLVGGTFIMDIAPTGQVTEIELPQDFLNSLPAGGQGFLSKDGLKQMMTQGAVAFPETPVKEGDTWSNDVEMKMPFGEMSIKQKNTYQGTNDDDLHVIGITLEMSLTPGEGQPFKMTLKDSSAKGTMLFDNRKGRLVKSEINQTMTMEMEVQGNTINQEIEQKIVVRTTDGKSSR